MELVAGEDSFTIYLWPESLPVMDVRRYSNYPHVSQGESTPADSPFWVDASYYPRDAFVGTSKTHEMILFFHDGAARSEEIDSLAADFQSPGLVYAGAEWYWSTGVALPTVLPGDRRFLLTGRNLDHAAQFTLFHQRHWNWYGKWDYGDIIHMFKRGYGKFVPAVRLAEILRLAPEERRRLSLDELQVRQDYWPPHDWAFDNGRWGWGNTEGLPNLFMQMQYLRTGDRDLYFFIEAMARHVRDVDMRHAGRFFGMGTRHGVQHWSDGDHEERQTVHSEFRYHYLLSGDARTAEFARRLCEEFYLRQPCEYHASHSGRLYGLLANWEMTNDPRLAETLRNYVHSLITPDGVLPNAKIVFPEGRREGDAGQVNDTSMFFLHFGAMHALLEYYELTRDPVLREGLIRYAEGGKGDLVEGNDVGGPLAAVAFAARYAGDRERYRAILRQRLTGAITRAYQQVPEDRACWTGRSAPVIHWPIALFWLNEVGYATSALEREVEVSAEDLATIREGARYDGPTQVPVERESWQSEFDRPEFREYLTPKRQLEE